MRGNSEQGWLLTVTGAAQLRVLSGDVAVVEVVVVDEVSTADALEDRLEVVAAVEAELELPGGNT